MKTLSVDTEFKNLIPPLTADEFNQLEANIITDGCRDPLVIWSGVILDGHNRYQICTAHNIEFSVIEKDFTERSEAINWIIDNQLGRRNLPPWQQSILRGKRYNAEKDNHGGARYQFDTLQTRTRDTLAEQYGVSPATIQRDGEFAAAAEQAAQETNIPLMQLTKAQIVQAANAIKQEKRDENRYRRIERIAGINEGNRPLDGLGPYPVIYADPPWQYDHPISDSRRIENQYPTMAIDDICALPVSKITTDDAILFLWVSTPMLEKGLRVLNEWGFSYRTSMVWVKPSIGPGQWVRQRHELLLIGVRGNIPTPQGENKPDSVIEAPREEHSKKPDRVYEIIEQMYPELQKVELFSRQPRHGWAAWGNQA